jgi:hypothetical protein
MSDTSARQRPRRVVLAVIACLGVLVGGATVAVAGTVREAMSADAAKSKVVHPNIVGAGHQGTCAVAYDTESSTLIPPDDTTSDNVPAATVTFTKTCQGAVFGIFSSEVSAPATGDFIHIDMLATCISKAGQPQPCVVGQQTFASPGHSFFRNGPESFGVGSIQMVWSGLPRGRWTFEVLPGGNNVANLQFRSFTVQSFNGG